MRLIVSGIIYLIGVAVILALKPQLMFKDDGVWKEFGIGRNTETHTWFPFWLFVILWALFSYIVTIIFIPGVSIPYVETNIRNQNSVRNQNVQNRRKNKNNSAEISPKELTPGYYVLNKEGSKDGVPRYVYLGAEPDSVPDALED